MTPFQEWSMKIEQAEDLTDIDACRKGIAEDHELSDSSRQTLEMACNLKEDDIHRQWEASEMAEYMHDHAELPPPSPAVSPSLASFSDAPITPPRGQAPTDGIQQPRTAGPFSDAHRDGGRESSERRVQRSPTSNEPLQVVGPRLLETPAAKPPAPSHSQPVRAKNYREESPETMTPDSKATNMSDKEKDEGGSGNEPTAIMVAAPRGALARLDAESIGVSMANAGFLAEQMIPNMVPEYHFGNPKDKYGKEAWDSKRLLEPGASLIRNAFRVIARPINIGRTETEEGYIREITVGIYPVDAPDVLLATGSGSCSTEETKYAYRWVKEDQIPPELDRTHLKRRGGSRDGKDWEQFRVPNPDLGDLDNTILKMALKRAEIDATYQLPGCSEIVRLINPDKYPGKTQRQMEETAKKAAPVVFGK